MAKIRREGSAPERNALRSHWPDPGRATVTRRRREYPGQTVARAVARTSTARSERSIPLDVALGAAEADMRDKQEVVSRLRAAGEDVQIAAHEARLARTRWLALRGGLDRKTVDVDQGSSVNPVKAV